MSISFRPALRENVGLIIGLAGGTGSGKTYTAMRLATGIAGGKPFAVIDTEAGRAKHYADQFKFDHGDLKPPFTPDAYAEAITEADKAGYPVIVVDSMSHVWAGDGGVLDWQEAELTRMAGTDYGKREACKMAAWIKPKMSHKHMVAKLLQVRAHLILCFRAEEKIEMVRDSGGKMKIIPKVTATGLNGWVPVSEKNLPFELTTSFLLTADAPGIPKPIKLQQQHRAIFPLDKPIDEESGKAIVAWAGGSSGSSQVDAALSAMQRAAALGTDALSAAWSGASKEQRRALASHLDALKKTAAQHDADDGEDIAFGAPAARTSAEQDAQPPAGGMPQITPEYIREMMGKAKDGDTMDIAEDFIRGVPEEHHAALHEFAVQRRSELRA